MIYKETPEAMFMSNSEYGRLLHEQTVRENAPEARDSRNIETLFEQDDYYASLVEADVNAAETADFLTNVKNSFVTECIFKLYKECLNELYPVSESDLVIGRNLVNKFVLEHGASNLITEFRFKNILLSEMSRISEKYYNKVLESINSRSEDDEAYGQAKEFVVDSEIRDNFYEELENVDTSDAVNLIKTRVSDSIENFVDTNIYEKLEYEDIIKAAQDRIDATQNEAYIEQFSMQAQQEIDEVRSKRKSNIFHCMVESLITATFKDEELRARYLNESGIDMDKVVDHTRLLYTMLEMVNTTYMEMVDAKYLNDYIDSLKA